MRRKRHTETMREKNKNEKPHEKRTEIERHLY